MRQGGLARTLEKARVAIQNALNNADLMTALSP